MPSFIGYVYDIDYIVNNKACQFLLRNEDEPMNIVVVTDNHQMQTILETAMVMGRPAEVSFEEGSPNMLMRAKLNLG